MTRVRWIILAVVLAIGLILLVYLLPTSKTVERADGAVVRSDAAHILKRAHRAYARGNRHKMNRILKKGRVMHDHPRRKYGPCSLRVGKPVPRCAQTARSTGGREAAWVVKIEQLGVGWDIMRSTFRQTFNWSHGKVTSVGKLHVESDVTGWGGAIGYEHEGIIGRYSRWGGRKHRAHTSSATDRYHACAPLGPGCILGKDEDITGSLTVRGNGKDSFDG